MTPGMVKKYLVRSSPARGTWIEMGMPQPLRIFDYVVPRKGDVDRNMLTAVALHGKELSSPARGTWIEMCNC